MEHEIIFALVQTEYHLKWSPQFVAPYPGDRVGDCEVVCPPVREGDRVRLTLRGLGEFRAKILLSNSKTLLARVTDLMATVEAYDFRIATVAIPEGLDLLKEIGPWKIGRADHPTIRTDHGITFHFADLCGTPCDRVEMGRSDVEPPADKPFIPLYAITVMGREMDFNIPFAKGKLMFGSFRDAFQHAMDMKNALDAGKQVTIPDPRLHNGPVGFQL